MRWAAPCPLGLPGLLLLLLLILLSLGPCLLPFAHWPLGVRLVHAATSLAASSTKRLAAASLLALYYAANRP